MGFRSTFVSEHWFIEWPQWFRDKWSASVWFPESGNGVIASKGEATTYGLWSELPEDIRRAIDWNDGDSPDDFVLVYLHECGGITRCQIDREGVKWTEPDSWRQTDGVEHSYCYGCSDADKAAKAVNL